MNKFGHAVVKQRALILIIAVLLMIPSVFGMQATRINYDMNTPVYYDFSNILTGDDISSIDNDDMQFLTANEKLSEDFGVSSTHMILLNSDVPKSDVKAMCKEIEKLDGVKYALGLDSALGSAIPDEMVPKELSDELKSEDYQLLLINSSFKVSTDECNEQIDQINEILKKYDENGMLIGEAPCTKDLIEVTNHDFSVVSLISIAAVFIIIAFVLGSGILPVILVLCIEFAIFINLGIPYYTDFALPFIAPVCISTIQLGSTVDYAILMTTRYKSERIGGAAKQDAVKKALAYAMPSMLVSALGFFAATFGVGVYSNISLISSMCNLVARGAIVSVLSVIFVLPSMLILCDKLVCRTTKGMKKVDLIVEGE